MEQVITTALLYIESFLAVDTASMDWVEADYELPSAYQSERDQRLVRGVLSGLSEPSLLFFKDRIHANYCYVKVQGKLLQIGPFRTKHIFRDSLPASLFESEEDRSRYLTELNHYPVLNRDQIRFAINLMLIGLYGASNIMDSEQEIDLTDPSSAILPLIEEPLETITVHGSSRGRGLSFYYISQICSGNSEDAIVAYRLIMNEKAKTFNLVDTLEGLSSFRTLTMVALHQAGVPDTSTDSLLTEYKLRCRKVNSIEAARRLSETMIYDACKLVRAKSAASYSRVIRLAVDFIQRNISSQFSIPDIADEVGLTPNALSAKFHKEVGMAPNAYISKLRMDNAAQMLAYTPMSISHICMRIGLYDANYFTRCFKKQFGITPSDYRKKYQS